MEAYWAHNLEVRGSNPRMDLQKYDNFRDHTLWSKKNYALVHGLLNDTWNISKINKFEYACYHTLDETFLTDHWLTMIFFSMRRFVDFCYWWKSAVVKHKIKWEITRRAEQKSVLKFSRTRSESFLSKLKRHYFAQKIVIYDENTINYSRDRWSFQW